MSARGMAVMSTSVCFNLLSTLLLFSPLLQPVWCREATDLSHSLTDGEFLEAERTRIIQCTMDTRASGLVGLKLYDVHDDSLLVSVQRLSGDCYTHRTLASCFVNDKESYVTLKAAITNMEVGKARTYECEASYVIGGKEKTKSVKKQVTLQAISTTTTTQFVTTQMAATDGSTTGLSLSSMVKIRASVFKKTTTMVTTTGAYAHEVKSAILDRTTSSKDVTKVSKATQKSTAESQSHTTESLRSSIDVLSLSIGSCVTLVLTVLVVVVIWLCRRQRGHAYPDLANAPYRLRLPVDIDEFFWNRIPAVYRRRASSHFDHDLEVEDAESLYLRPQDRALQAGRRNAQVRRQRPPATSNGRHRRSLRDSLYLTPTHNTRAQRPLPNPHHGQSEATAVKRVVAHSHSSTGRGQATIPLDPPAPHTFGQEAVHVSSPYEEVS